MRGFKVFPSFSSTTFIFNGRLTIRSTHQGITFEGHERINKREDAIAYTEMLGNAWNDHVKRKSESKEIIKQAEVTAQPSECGTPHRASAEAKDIS